MLRCPGQCYYSGLPNQRTYRFNADAIHAIKSLQNRIRSEAPDDPTLIEALNFDPESDVQQPEAEAKIRELMGDVADYAGLAPDLAYAIRKTGLLVTDRSKHLLDDDQLAAWNAAIEEYGGFVHRVQ